MMETTSMTKITLFDTPYARSRCLESMLLPAVTFLVKQGPLVILTDDQVAELSNLRIYSSNPLTKLFQDLTVAGALRNFVYTNLSRMSSDIPQILALDDVVVDGKMVPNVTVPTQLQKCWINITPFTSSRDSYNGGVNITDASAFASVVVRAALCQTYDDAGDMWLSPRLAACIVESYAQTISHVCRQAYNLSYEETQFVATLFAAYYSQVLSGPTSSLKMPPMLMRCPFLGSGQDIVRRMEDINQYRENMGDDLLTPYKICAILAKCGPARMNTFSPQQLYRFVSSSAVDSQVMLIAIDYPPYWAYQMLRVIAGVKNPLMSTVMKMNPKLKTTMTQFATELQSTGAILQKLQRG